MTQIYIGIGALALVAGLYYMQTKKDAASTNTSISQGSKGSFPVVAIDPAAIDKLTIKAKDKPEVKPPLVQMVMKMAVPGPLIRQTLGK